MCHLYGQARLFFRFHFLSTAPEIDSYLVNLIEFAIITAIVFAMTRIFIGQPWTLRTEWNTKRNNKPLTYTHTPPLPMQRQQTKDGIESKKGKSKWENKNIQIHWITLTNDNNKFSWFVTLNRWHSFVSFVKWKGSSRSY